MEALIQAYHKYMQLHKDIYDVLILIRDCDCNLLDRRVVDMMKKYLVDNTRTIEFKPEHYPGILANYCRVNQCGNAIFDAAINHSMGWILWWNSMDIFAQMANCGDIASKITILGYVIKRFDFILDESPNIDSNPDNMTMITLGIHNNNQHQRIISFDTAQNLCRMIRIHLATDAILTSKLKSLEFENETLRKYAEEDHKKIRYLENMVIELKQSIDGELHEYNYDDIRQRLDPIRDELKMMQRVFMKAVRLRYAIPVAEVVKLL